VDSPDRDRFMSSAGHGPVRQYGPLHVFSCDLPLAELQNFCQLRSATSGHPGTRATGAPTYPRHQDDDRVARPGLANAVGMALGERMLHALAGFITIRAVIGFGA